MTNFTENQASPFALFSDWFAEANDCKAIEEANAMNIASVGANGAPSNRMVLLKDFDERGFVFFTNLESRKGTEILANPQVSLCFYWEALGKQVRIEGTADQVSDAEADAYFASRPLQSRIGAWASKQSRPIQHGTDLLKEVAVQTARFATGKVDRPPHWSGFCVEPRRIEFWHRGEFRLHTRLVYLRENNSESHWNTQKLYP